MTEAEVMALSAIVMAEACEINAANAVRERAGEAMAYDGFLDSYGALESLVKELKTREKL